MAISKKTFTTEKMIKEIAKIAAENYPHTYEVKTVKQAGYVDEIIVTVKMFKKRDDDEE